VDAPIVTPPFERRIPGQITAKGVTILQVNTGYQCNLECRHFHVAAGGGSRGDHVGRNDGAMRRGHRGMTTP
jgi:hypothetical protein